MSEDEPFVSLREPRRSRHVWAQFLFSALVSAAVGGVLLAIVVEDGTWARMGLLRQGGRVHALNESCRLEYATTCFGPWTCMESLCSMYSAGLGAHTCLVPFPDDTETVPCSTSAPFGDILSIGAFSWSFALAIVAIGLHLVAAALLAELVHGGAGERMRRGIYRWFLAVFAAMKALLIIGFGIGAFDGLASQRRLTGDAAPASLIAAQGWARGFVLALAVVEPLWNGSELARSLARFV